MYPSGADFDECFEELPGNFQGEAVHGTGDIEDKISIFPTRYLRVCDLFRWLHHEEEEILFFPLEK